MGNKLNGLTLLSAHMLQIGLEKYAETIPMNDDEKTTHKYLMSQIDRIINYLLEHET